MNLSRPLVPPGVPLRRSTVVIEPVTFFSSLAHDDLLHYSACWQGVGETVTLPHI